MPWSGERLLWLSETSVLGGLQRHVAQEAFAVLVFIPELLSCVALLFSVLVLVLLC